MICIFMKEVSSEIVLEERIQLGKMRGYVGRPFNEDMSKVLEAEYTE